MFLLLTASPLLHLAAEDASEQAEESAAEEAARVPSLVSPSSLSMVFRFRWLTLAAEACDVDGLRPDVVGRGGAGFELLLESSLRSGVIMTIAV